MTFSKNLLSLIFFLFLVEPLAAADIYERINANNDRQFWIEQNFDKNFSNGYMLRLYFEQRWGSNYRIPFFNKAEIVFQYDLLKKLKLSPSNPIKNFFLGPGYHRTLAFGRNQRDQFHWRGINRFLIQSNLLASWKNWDLDNRNRLEYHQNTRPHYENFTAFRCRVQIATPWRWTTIKIRPFFSNEWFFREDTFKVTTRRGLVGNWYENRLRVGVMTDLYKGIFVPIFYWQWILRKTPPQTRPDWNNNYVFGVALNFSF